METSTRPESQPQYCVFCGKCSVNIDDICIRYIANLWRNAHRNTPTVRKITDYGWIEIEERYALKWFEGKQVPDTVEEVLYRQKPLVPVADVEMESASDGDDSDLEYHPSGSESSSEEDSDYVDSDSEGEID
ncbi:hypothetical protein QAD02_009065 [Eretmocerus hayati]|uniref:Uncharacterized protein n=1 Tax=Eretmocerus hayati TaxID=131215 RepID=A0ACC2N8L4_9HYME|nr:hypothetical protein QAD02_009065 [Eretmocerus hayati]